MTTPYNPHGNSICERFNHTLLGLLLSLPKEQKSCWPLHVPSLVFAYNPTPHMLLDISLMSSCFGIKHLPFMMPAWGWPIIMIMPQPTSVCG